MCINTDNYICTLNPATPVPETQPPNKLILDIHKRPFVRTLFITAKNWKKILFVVLHVRGC